MHTPGKWKENWGRVFSEDNTLLFGLTDYSAIPDRAIPEEERIANAQRICLMNNSFDELLEACRTLFGEFEQVIPQLSQEITDSKQHTLRIQNSLNNAFSAIAKAKGE